MALTLKKAAEGKENEAVFEEDIVIPARKVSITKSQLIANRAHLVKALEEIDKKLTTMAILEEENHG